MYSKTPEEIKREEMVCLVKEVLGKEFLELSITKLSLQEDIESGNTVTSYSFTENSKSKKVTKAKGSGVLDCVFSSLVEKYSEFTSLSSVKLIAFDVITDFKARDSSGTDALVTVSARFLSEHQNSCTLFRASSNSIVSALSKCAVHVVQYYLNCEKAFRKLKFLIEDAKKRNRQDVASGYVSKISRLVNSNIIRFDEIVK